MLIVLKYPNSLCRFLLPVAIVYVLMWPYKEGNFVSHCRMNRELEMAASTSIPLAAILVALCSLSAAAPAPSKFIKSSVMYAHVLRILFKVCWL